MSVELFVTSISGSMKIKEQQALIRRILDTKKIDYEEIDVSDPKNSDRKLKMQETVRSKGKSVVPPHVFRGDDYLGDAEEFMIAVEDDLVEDFLKIPGAKKTSPFITSGTEKGENDSIDSEKKSLAVHGENDNGDVIAEDVTAEKDADENDSSGETNENESKDEPDKECDESKADESEKQTDESSDTKQEEKDVDSSETAHIVSEDNVEEKTDSLEPEKKTEKSELDENEDNVEEKTDSLEPEKKTEKSELDEKEANVNEEESHKSEELPEREKSPAASENADKVASDSSDKD